MPAITFSLIAFATSNSAFAASLAIASFPAFLAAVTSSSVVALSIAAIALFASSATFAFASAFLSAGKSALLSIASVAFLAASSTSFLTANLSISFRSFAAVANFDFNLSILA